MASRTTTDPIEILLEMGVDLDNLSEEEDYLSALKEAIATIQFQTKGAGDERSTILQQEVVKVRKQRKAADPKFKARKTKISADTFKKGSAAGVNVAPKALPTSAIVPYQAPGAEQEEGKKKRKKKEEPKNLLAEIADSVSNIADILKDQYNLEEDEGEFDRKKAQRDRRKLAKENLKKGFGALFKTAENIVKPVRSIFDRIFGFIANILIGKFLMKLVGWFGDPQNRKKINNIIEFLGKHWPKLLSLYLVFGTGLGRLVFRFTKLLIGGAIKLTVAVAKLLAAKKIVSGLGARRLARFLGGRPGKILTAGLTTATVVGGTYAATNALAGGGEQQTQGFSGGGLASPPKKPNGMGGRPGSFRLPPGMEMIGGGGGTNAITGQAKSRSLMSILSDPFGSKLRKKQFNDPQFYLTDEEYENREESGQVDGPGGDDKVPAMLTAGEFVMSRGAVQRFGVKQLEAMNAAGGGTNQPKVVDNKVYASVGGYIGNLIGLGKKGTPDPGNGSSKPSGANSPKQRTPDILGTLSRLIPEIGRRFPWAAKVVDPAFYGRVGGEAQKIIQPTVERAMRVGGESQKMIQPTVERAMRVGGEIQNVANQKISDTVAGAKSVVDTLKGQDYGGMIDSVKNMYGAAEEAVPALLGGLFGMDRVDKHISKDMQRAILDAKKTAEARGSKNIDYGDYEGGGLSAAGLTMGRVGDKEFKRDAQGRIIGLTQTFDTNRPAEEAMLQAQIAATKFLGIDNTGATNKLRDLITTRMKSEGASPEDIKNAIKYIKPGGDAGNVKDAARAIYKPFEALLDTVQGRGTTTHDVMFDKDVLGFDPVEAPPKPGSPNYQLFKDGGGMAALSQGKTVGQIVDAGRSANSTNPIMEFLGLSKQKPTEESESSPTPVQRNKRGRPINQNPTIEVAPQTPNVAAPEPPPNPAVTVVKVPSKKHRGGKRAAPRGGSRTPDINAGNGSNSKRKILGIF